MAVITASLALFVTFMSTTRALLWHYSNKKPKLRSSRDLASISVRTGISTVIKVSGHRCDNGPQKWWRARVKFKMRVAKVRVGILRVEV